MDEDTQEGVTRRQTLATLGIAALSAGALPRVALAQAAYPAKAVRLIVPVGAGSGFDATARVIADRLAARLGQPFVVDNQPGAGTALGVASVAHAVPDGYTIGILLSPVTIQQSLNRNMGFDVRKDLAPIALVGWDYNVLAVNAALPVKTPQELVAELKKKPGQYNYGSGGTGTPAHIAAELFKLVTGTDMVHVPYKTANAAVQDLIANRVQIMFSNLPAAAPFVKTGQLRALAIVGDRRVSSYPGVPSIAEAGFPEVSVPNWTGFIAPAKTPAPLISQLFQEISAIMAEPEVLEKIKRFDTVVDVKGPEALGKLIDSDVARWADVVHRANIKIDS